jgi:2-polyprenyl-3-methyl-5-hydroxy-6-metoxy-1,4-benzoquinol methylase
MTPATTQSTPLRERSNSTSEGLHFLDDAGLTYHDGGESRVLELLRAASDLSSTSDELVTKAHTWSVRYHFDPTRANIVRPLRLDASQVVLEIGAGCGAITRYLGEVCGTVDAIEPMADRAACARERTRDLENVEVFVGLLEDIPLQPAYDVVVVIGVLEYVGQGSADTSIYASFLARAAKLLVPGGTLVLGIENRLGVKYLAGAPEDHSGRFFENIEGYDQDSIARTFSRKELETFMTQADLDVRTFGAFPDYKLTRCVIDDALFNERPELATTVPRFPSPDWNGGGHRVANESRIWANLVSAGMGPQTSNSLLLLGHLGKGPSPLWDSSNLLTYYSPPGLRPTFSVETTIRRSEGGTLEWVRRPLLASVIDSDMTIALAPQPLVEGRDLLQVIIEITSKDELIAVLLSWRDALDALLQSGARPHLDLIAHNAIRADDGSIHFVDSKWNLDGFDRQAIIERAALVLAMQLAVRTTSTRWPVTTVRELAVYLGVCLGLAEDGQWLDEALVREAQFHATLNTPAPDDTDLDTQSARIRDEFENLFGRPLRSFGGYSPVDMAADMSEMMREIRQAQLAVRNLEATKLFRYSQIPRQMFYRLRAKVSKQRTPIT